MLNGKHISPCLISGAALLTHDNSYRGAVVANADYTTSTSESTPTVTALAFG